MITKIQVRDNQIENKTVKQIEMFIGGLLFRCDVQSETDIKQAQRIADECGEKLYRVDMEQSEKENKPVIIRTWSNQHPNSLDDLDLSYFNLDGANEDKVSWEDCSWKNESRPSFMTFQSNKKAFLLYLDHKAIEKRECKNEDRFLLLLLPRTDDGTSLENYKVDLIQGDEPILYMGSDVKALIGVIEANKMLQNNKY
jgi:hypothetical protein